MTRISRHFNYTHRVRILASKVHVEVERGEDGRYRGFVKKVDFSEHGRHAEDVWKAANVVVEARRVSTGSYHQQVLGTVADIQQERPISPIELAEFPDDSEIVFRFKVVDADKKLLGEVDNIRAGERSQTEREPLIPLIPTELKEELWKVDNSDEAMGPVVLVNKRLPNASGLLTSDPLVCGLIMPQIVRQVLSLIANSEELQSEPWAVNWISFADRLGHPLPDPPDEEIVQDWVENVVGSFTDSFKLATVAETRMRTQMGAEEA